MGGIAFVYDEEGRETEKVFDLCVSLNELKAAVDGTEVRDIDRIEVRDTSEE